MFSIHRHDEPCVLPKEQENLFTSEEEAQETLDALLDTQIADALRYVNPPGLEAAIRFGYGVRPTPQDEAQSDQAQEPQDD